VTVWTIGHSTHSEAAFLALLRAHGIESVADVRSVPRSRRLPHFWAERMAEWLPSAGVAYRHLPRLGGWRRTHHDSPNGGWHNASFRGFADYALGDEFAVGLAELRELAAPARTAMLCSEGLWWRCHRRLIADQLLRAGDDVCHIAPDGRTEPHRLTPFAVPQPDGTLRYPP
jgi:uncharacterized protein (DUF488 family)